MTGGIMPGGYARGRGHDLRDEDEEEAEMSQNCLEASMSSEPQPNQE